METQDLLIQLLRDTNEKVDRILAQTTKTNGRVNRIEDRQDSIEVIVDGLKEDSNINKGRDKVIYIFLVGAATILGFAIQHFLSLHK